jgi:DNA gyrase/topoisomerase IV subunit B
MRGFANWFGATVAGLFLVGAAAAADEKTKEEKVSADKLPRAVMAAIKAHFPDPEFTSLTKETTGTKVVYDIELKQKGRKHEMDVREDGTVLEIENEVAAKDLPEAVTKALDAKYPKAAIKEAMEVNKVTGKDLKLLHYELTVETAGGKKMEVLVTADGKSVKTEEEEKKEEKK